MICALALILLDDWHGIDTDGNDRVTHLKLKGNGLRGTIPASFGGAFGLLNILPFPGHLALADYELSGSIPAELGLFTGLRALDLSGKRLSGSRPDEMVNLTRLELLYLDSGYNNFTECFPDAMQNVAAPRPLYPVPTAQRRPGTAT